MRISPKMLEAKITYPKLVQISKIMQLDLKTVNLIIKCETFCRTKLGVSYRYIQKISIKMVIKLTAK